MSLTNMNTTSIEENSIELCLQKLRKIIEGVDVFENVHASDNYILRFLYSCEFNVDEAFKRMKGYQEHIQQCPLFYPVSGPLDRKFIVKERISSLLPHCDKEGRFILFHKLSNINYSKISLIELSQLDDNWYEYVLCKNPKSAGKGICYLVDVKDQSYGFLRWLSITNTKIVLKKIANSPFKEIVIHVVNKSLGAQIATNIVLPFMPEASKKNIFFHLTNWKSLHKHIDPSCLPKEYGGNMEMDYESIYRRFYDAHEEIVKSYRDVRYQRNE